MEERHYQCSVCRNMFLFSDLKYNHAQKLICQSCTKSPEKTMQRKANFVEKPNEATARFICGVCNYQFKRKDKPEFAKICPYCGKPAVRKHESISASQILSEV